MSNRDSFSAGVKGVLASRAAYRCSRPSCRAVTIGPSNEGPHALTNVGVASHITAAAPRGPRYDATLSEEERSSIANGIWLCSVHGKEVDDDEVTFTVDVLHAWKRGAEDTARALIGRPISAQSLDIALQIAMHRAADDTMLVTGTTNLPDATKLWVELYDGAARAQQTVQTVVIAGMFAAGGFKGEGRPLPHGWCTVGVLAYFNGPWKQPEAVMAIVGRDGEFLVGRFAEPLHPELEESEKRLRATFQCVAPPLSGLAERTSTQLEHAIQVAQRAILTVDGRRSSASLAETVEWFMSCPNLCPRDGWSASPLASGAVLVTYSFWNGKGNPAVCEWTVIPEREDVRYRNLYGKLMSYLTPD